jgi:DNA-directed RNA polymerase subunit beta
MPIQRFFLSDFVGIQRNSFLQFLETGLIEEFSKRNPITNTSKTLEVFFYPEYYQLTEPNYTTRQAILKGKSYASRLFVPVQLTDKKARVIKLKWVYIADIPIMTKRGHFIINGAARVIVNQIIRSPGIYFQTKVYEEFSNKWSQKADHFYERFYADLICQRGTWLRLEIDKEKKIWAQTKKGPKIPIMWLLIAMGLTEKIILKSVIDPHRLLYNMFKDPTKGQNNKKEPPIYIKTPPEAWAEIYCLFNKKKKKNYPAPTGAGHLVKTGYGSKSIQPLAGINKNQLLSVLGRKLIFNKFMNPRTYDLSKQGRLNFNKKFNLSISAYQTTLTPQDLLAATDYLLKVEYGLKKVDDIDNLKNRRVRTSGELIQIQFGTGLVRLEKTIRDKISRADNSFSPKIAKFSFISKNKKPSPDRGLAYSSTQGSVARGQTYKISINSLINTKAVNSTLREFFGTSPLSQFMDQINPLAEITHKRRLSSMGPGGVTRDSATLDIRGIHPSHYGRICPVETPEGKNTGLVNSLTTYARVNSHGYIETPFYKVYKGQVQKKTGMYFFSAEQENKIKLGAADLFASDLGFLSAGGCQPPADKKLNIPVRIEEEFSKISRNDVDFVGVSPTQMVSIATSLIPFLEHDDANRALMGSNMQRQAVPILKPERPIVGTGLEARAVSDSGHALQTKFSGLITYVSSEKIVIYHRPKN